MKVIILLSLLILIISACRRNTTSENKKFEIEKSKNIPCDYANKIDSLIQIIINDYNIIGYSEQARKRGYDVIKSNAFISDKREYENSFGVKFKSFNLIDIRNDSIRGGILEFMSYTFSLDSTQFHTEIIYNGDYNTSMKNAVLEYDFDFLNCTWVLTKSTYSVY